MASSARHRHRRLLTLSTDLGAAYAAQVKAVLARRLAPGTVVELTHDLPAHGIAESAFLLRAMAIGFPAGSVHLAVVDPGVGGRRAPIAVACADGSRLVGPDNGLLFPLAEALGDPRAYRIEPSRLGTGRRVGTTFDARDLFAPAAARLAQGARPASLGPPVRALPYRLPHPTRRGGRIAGEVLHVDRFGNLITNVPTEWAETTASRRLDADFGRGRRSLPWVTSYEELGRGRLGALGSSFGTVEFAVAEGRAADRLGLRPGARVELGPSRTRVRVSIGK